MPAGYVQVALLNCSLSFRSQARLCRHHKCALTAGRLRHHHSRLAGQVGKDALKLMLRMQTMSYAPVMTSMPPGVSRTLEMPPVCPRSIMRCRPPACSSEGVRVNRQGEAAAAWRPASSVPPSSLDNHSCMCQRLSVSLQVCYDVQHCQAHARELISSEQKIS